MEYDSLTHADLALCVPELPEFKMPEQRLLKAIIEAALDLMIKYTIKPPVGKRQVRIYAETMTWLTSLDGDEPRSCGWVLDHLRIDRDAFARGVKQIPRRLDTQEVSFIPTQALVKRIDDDHPYVGIQRRKNINQPDTWLARMSKGQGRIRQTFSTAEEALAWRQSMIRKFAEQKSYA